MSVPAVRRIVVGVDGSAGSAAALHWACREASLRGAEVHAVHAWEAPCYPAASYAVPTALTRSPERGDFDGLWRAVLPDRVPGVPDAQGGPGAPGVPGVRVRTEVAAGLAARVLLQRCEGADMLVLGTCGGQAEPPGTSSGSCRSAGPVIRACLRRSPCPVVVINSAQEPLPGRDDAGRPADAHVSAPHVSAPPGAVSVDAAPVGAASAAAVPSGAAVPSAAAPAGTGRPLGVIPFPASLPV